MKRHDIRDHTDTKFGGLGSSFKERQKERKKERKKDRKKEGSVLNS
jgi:hypothetical protein